MHLVVRLAIQDKDGRQITVQSVCLKRFRISGNPITGLMLWNMYSQGFVGLGMVPNSAAFFYTLIGKPALPWGLMHITGWLDRNGDRPITETNQRNERQAYCGIHRTQAELPTLTPVQRFKVKIPRGYQKVWMSPHRLTFSKPHGTIFLKSPISFECSVKRSSSLKAPLGQVSAKCFMHRLIILSAELWHRRYHYSQFTAGKLRWSAFKLLEQLFKASHLGSNERFKSRR